MASSTLVNKIGIRSNIGFSTNVSPDGQAATVIFDNLHVDINSAQAGGAGTLNQTAIHTKVVTVDIPYTTDQRSVAMLMEVRGYVNADPGAVARLVVCAGGTTKVVELSTGKSATIKLKGKSKDLVTAEHAGVQLGDFESRVEFTTQTNAAKPVCQITLFLLVEHNTDTAGSGGALLAVDSLDLSITGSGKASYKA